MLLTQSPSSCLGLRDLYYHWSRLSSSAPHTDLKLLNNRYLLIPARTLKQHNTNCGQSSSTLVLDRSPQNCVTRSTPFTRSPQTAAHRAVRAQHHKNKDLEDLRRHRETKSVLPHQTKRKQRLNIPGPSTCLSGWRRLIWDCSKFRGEDNRSLDTCGDLNI